MPTHVVLVQHIASSIDLLQQLMLQPLSLFGSYFSKLILLFSVYIGCFTATAKIIRWITDVLIHYNTILNNAFCISLYVFYHRIIRRIEKVKSNSIVVNKKLNRGLVL